MPCKFLTAQEALNFLWTSDGSALDDIENELDFAAGKSPTETFELICSKLIELTVEESIKYSKQNNNPVFEISMDEMKQICAKLYVPTKLIKVLFKSSTSAIALLIYLEWVERKIPLSVNIVTAIPQSLFVRLAPLLSYVIGPLITPHLCSAVKCWKFPADWTAVYLYKRMQDSFLTPSLIHVNSGHFFSKLSQRKTMTDRGYSPTPAGPGRPNNHLIEKKGSQLGFDRQAGW
ncbi:hypothetical protein AVEN_88714-1 [Araneus ventricosus]|uniref:Uncharacterized protein n=1 Tax=Araneus ventricosus TaxID=182803 RepID=A0A4Y2TRX6_ARAVE|nr:hypothetical protein AVEN_122202-1 [Araneus ventricosus]GBO03393.1 hypothetical protein AVEN_88714-1 [Araneus ventricosus]